MDKYGKGKKSERVWQRERERDEGLKVRDGEKAAVVAPAGRLKSGVRITCITAAPIVAFDYHEDEQTEVNLHQTREISPQQYRKGKSADGSELVK